MDLRRDRWNGACGTFSSCNIIPDLQGLERGVQAEGAKGSETGVGKPSVEVISVFVVAFKKRVV